MLEDICHYWLQHGANIDLGDEPAAATIFLKKIVASNYMLCIQYIRSVACQLEYIISSRNARWSELSNQWAFEHWTTLQQWSLHCSRYCESIDDILDNFQLHDQNSQGTDNWRGCESDFKVIRRGLYGVEERLNGLVSSTTGLNGILGNRSALQEARRVKVLTILGMTFLPLTFASGLLSMNSSFLPGSSHFWVFFAIALPLVLIVFGIVFIANRILQIIGSMQRISIS